MIQPSSNIQKSEQTEVAADPFLKILPAVLPLLIYLNDWHSLMFLTVLTTAAHIVTAYFFAAMHSFFPKKTIRISLIFWLGALGQAVWYLSGLLPFWIVSVYFLFPQELLRGKRKKITQAMLLEDIEFLWLLALAGGAQAILKKSGLAALFEIPFGILFLLGISVWVLDSGLERS